MTKIGKYEVLEKIGTGGFGVVFKGRDPFIKRFVAIKTCSSEAEDVRRRFYREAEIAGNLQHRNVVTVYDFGLQEDVPYLVQEYLPGEDLDQVIARRTLGDAAKLEYLMQIATGLQYAHAQGVIHRDIKPSNVRVVEGGRIKIMDFGIAKLANLESQLTKTGMTLGTASYLAPEQIRGEDLTHAADIFSFGVLAFELFAHRRPFEGQSLSNLFYQILSIEPPLLDTLAAGCPPELAAIVQRCLDKDPARRWRDCGELLSALEPLRDRMGAGAGDVERTQVLGGAGAAEAGETLSLTASAAQRELATVEARVRELLAAGNATAAEIEVTLARKRFAAAPQAAKVLGSLAERISGERDRRDAHRRQAEKLDALVARGRELARAGDHAEAMLVLHTALDLDGSHAAAGALLAEVEAAVAAAERARLEERERKLREEEQRRHQLAEALAETDALISAGDLRGAERSLRRGAARFGEVPEVVAAGERLQTARAAAEAEAAAREQARLEAASAAAAEREAARQREQAEAEERARQKAEAARLAAAEKAAARQREQEAAAERARQKSEAARQAADERARQKAEAARLKADEEARRKAEREAQREADRQAQQQAEDARRREAEDRKRVAEERRAREAEERRRREEAERAAAAAAAAVAERSAAAEQERAATALSTAERRAVVADLQRDGEPASPARWRWTALAAAGVAGLVLIGWLWMGGGSGESPREPVAAALAAPAAGPADLPESSSGPPAAEGPVATPVGTGTASAPSEPPISEPVPPAPAPPPGPPALDEATRAALVAARRALERGDVATALRPAGEAWRRAGADTEVKTLLAGLTTAARRAAATAEREALGAGAAELAAPQLAVATTARRAGERLAGEGGPAGAEALWRSAGLFRDAASAAGVEGARREAARREQARQEEARAAAAQTPPPSGPARQEAQEPRPVPPAPAPAPPATDDTAAIEAAIGRYRAASESLDVAAVQAVWPGVNVETLRRSYANYQSLHMRVTGCQIQRQGATATAECRREQEVRPKAGRAPPPVNQRVLFRLRRAGNTWLIDAVEAL